MKQLLADSINDSIKSLYMLLNLRSITIIMSSVFTGTDPPEGNVPSLHRRPDWSPVLEHRERRQQGLQQHRLPVLLHALPHVRCPHAHRTNL